MPKCHKFWPDYQSDDFLAFPLARPTFSELAATLTRHSITIEPIAAPINLTEHLILRKF